MIPMNKHRLKTLAFATAFTMSGVAAVSGLQAGTLENVFQVSQAKSADAQKSQQRIDKLADDTRDRLSDYKQVLKQTEGLKVYIARLDKQINDQNRRRDLVLP